MEIRPETEQAKTGAAWTIDESEIARIVGDWYRFNSYEPKETFTREEVKSLMEISRKDMQRRLAEIQKIVEEGRKLFAEYDEQKTKQITDLESQLAEKDKDMDQFAIDVLIFCMNEAVRKNPLIVVNGEDMDLRKLSAELQADNIIKLYKQSLTK